MKALMKGLSAALIARLHQRRRVRPVRQTSAGDCGAACLAMILRHHGLASQIAATRDRLGAGRDGATARDIVQAARAAGLRVSAFSVEPADLPRLAMPAIVHWRFNHFVVVERWARACVTIVDPAVGRRRLTAEEFSAGFTGVVLTFAPDDRAPARPTAATMQTATFSTGRYLSRLVSAPGCRGLMLQIVGASLLLQLLALGLPAFTKVLVDDVLPKAAAQPMMTLAVGLVLLAVTQGIVGHLRSLLLVYLKAQLDATMMLGFFRHLLALPFRFFEQRASGDLLMRLSSNAAIREFLTGHTLSAVLDGALVVIALIVLWVLHPFFAAIVVCAGMLQAALLLGTGSRVRRLNERELATVSSSQSYLFEMLMGVGTLKAAGGEPMALDRWSRLFFAQLTASCERDRAMALVNTLLATLRTYSPMLLLCLGAGQVLDGTLTLGELLALCALASSFLTPVGSLVASGQQLQLVSGHVERLLDVLRMSPEQAIDGLAPAPALTGRIDLQHVSFRYEPSAPLVLEDVSLTIEPGQKIALVGRTGSGKSTLLKLLLGLYAPSAGEIRYDGRPLQQMALQTLRRQFGVVLQESCLFSGSIRENIAFDRPDLPLARVADAAAAAQMHDEIARMPMAYETLLADAGTGLSGGERQRLAIARALSRQPAILFFDEATSHLDTVTESRLEAALSALPCTRVVVAHRLSTIRDADLILVLDRGRIVERGCHAELLARQGAYADLVKRQSDSVNRSSAATPPTSRSSAGSSMNRISASV